MSGAEITSSNDSASFAKANRKQLLADTGTNIEAATKTGSGQLTYSTDTSSRKWHGKYYGLTNTGTVWNALENSLLYPSKYGKFNPCSATFTENTDGLFSGAISYGTVAVPAVDTTWGSNVTFTTGAGAGNTAGFRLGSRFSIRDFNPCCRFRVKADASSNLRWFIGLVGDTAELGNTDDPLNGLNGFLFGKTTAQANFRCLHNDGVGATISDDTGVAADNSPHYIDIYTKGAATATLYMTIDSVLTNTVTTEIPGATSTLSFQMTIINAGGTRVMTVYDAYIGSDL